jgi:hypothetical protein
MAMAPWYQHERLLHAAIRKAAAVLRAPIDRIEVTPGKVLFRAQTFPIPGKTRQLTISYRYIANPSPSLGASAHLLLDGEEPSRSDDAPRAGHARLPHWREREELLQASVSKATAVLNACIDRVEVAPGKVMLFAAASELAISYQYVKNPNGWLKPRGFLLDGEDYWECFGP